MNTAIRDGHDIGWKLAWVLKGWAGAELLDSYEEERRPVALHNMRRSSDPNGSVQEAAEALRVDLGSRIRHVWVGSGAEPHSTLDLLSPGLTLFTTAGAPRAEGERGRAPVTVRELPPPAAGALGIGPGESLLVRPDGLPVRRRGREGGAPSSVRLDHRIAEEITIARFKSTTVRSHRRWAACTRARQRSRGGFAAASTPPRSRTPRHS